MAKRIEIPAKRRRQLPDHAQIATRTVASLHLPGRLPSRPVAPPRPRIVDEKNF